MARGRARGVNRRRHFWTWRSSAPESGSETAEREDVGEDSRTASGGGEAAAAASLDQVLRHAAAARGGLGAGGSSGGDVTGVGSASREG